MSELERLIRAIEVIHKVAGDMLDPERRRGPEGPISSPEPPRQITLDFGERYDEN